MKIKIVGIGVAIILLIIVIGAWCWQENAKHEEYDVIVTEDLVSIKGYLFVREGVDILDLNIKPITINKERVESIEINKVRINRYLYEVETEKKSRLSGYPIIFYEHEGESLFIYGDRIVEYGTESICYIIQIKYVSIPHDPFYRIEVMKVIVTYL